MDFYEWSYSRYDYDYDYDLKRRSGKFIVTWRGETVEIDTRSYSYEVGDDVVRNQAWVSRNDILTELKSHGWHVTNEHRFIERTRLDTLFLRRRIPDDELEPDSPLDKLT